MRPLALLGMLLLAAGVQAARADGVDAAQRGALASTPVVPEDVQNRRGDDTRPADVDLARAFWIEPSWSNLEQYAYFLKFRDPDHPTGTPFAPDAALDRMKAHLALGILGRKSAPFADWADLKRKTVQHAHMSKETRRLEAQGDTDAHQIGIAMRDVLGLWDSERNAGDSAGERRILALVDALAFARVAPSLFRSEAQVAPPDASAEQASGRFGIVYRQLVAALPPALPGAGDETGYRNGLYDMKSRTDALVRPVQHVQLRRDGRLRSQASVLRKTELFWDGDAPICVGWTPGFVFGEADAGTWRHFAAAAGVHKNMSRSVRGSLFSFYTTLALAPGKAAVRQATVKLDRARTGFVKGTYLYYDLDADGIADLAVWEGQGKGEDYLNSPTSTDGAWYRLLLVNIKGAWKVLGNDSFSDSCG